MKPITKTEVIECLNLWHVSRTACSGSGTNRHDRMVWVATTYAAEHSTGADACSVDRAYKIISRTLDDPGYEGDEAP